MSTSHASKAGHGTADRTPDIGARGLLRGAIGLAAVAVALFGVAYPLIGVGLGQAVFPDAARGSLLARDGRVVGSALAAQPFADPRYVHPRPSASAYDGMTLAGSNLARTNPALQDRIAVERAAVASREGVDPSAVPADLVTQSGSGFDPHVSPAGAAIQIDRVARARGVDRAVVARLVGQHTEGRQFGLLGEARVNVVMLNLALDAVAPVRSPAVRTPGG